MEIKEDQPFWHRCDTGRSCSRCYGASVVQVVRAAKQAAKVKKTTILQGWRSQDREPRKVVMYLVRRFSDLTLQETAEEFGVVSDETMGSASSQVNMIRVKDKVLDRKVNH